MNIIAATNWDPGLIDRLSEFPQVKEEFGVMQKTPVGSARPFFIVANPHQEEVAQYIEKVHASGRKFNYLLNGACMNNMEYDKKTHHQLLDHIRWVREAGADSVTVTIPYLLELIKKQFPSLEVRVSLIAHVNSVQRAKLFENLGADAITLDFNINRDFKLLEKIREAVNVKLSLIVNDGCLYQCPYRYYHYNILAHCTQPYNPLEGFYIDYCILHCTIDKFSNPEEIIKSRWIRPEDIHHYEEIGIDTFKISGRRMSTHWLMNAVNAYSEQKYIGNLFDILNCVAPGVDPDIQSPQYQAFLEKTEFLKREKLIQLGQLYPVKPHIDNHALEGFIDYFKTKDCLSGCGDCQYCRNIAHKAVDVESTQPAKYVGALRDVLNDLITSRIFEDSEPETHHRPADTLLPSSLTWSPTVREIFDDIVQKVPETFRDIATKIVKQKAETNAVQRNSNVVEETDMVKAFLSETPEFFKDQMLSGLQGKGIDPGNYI